MAMNADVVLKGLSVVIKNSVLSTRTTLRAVRKILRKARYLVMMLYNINNPRNRKYHKIEDYLVLT